MSFAGFGNSRRDKQNGKSREMEKADDREHREVTVARDRAPRDEVGHDAGLLSSRVPPL